MSEQRYESLPCPLFDKPLGRGKGSAEMVMLDMTKLNKHNFHFMIKRLDMVTKDMLEASKKLQEVSELVDKIKEDQPGEDYVIGYISGDIKALESRFDKWMMNQENDEEE